MKKRGLFLTLIVYFAGGYLTLNAYNAGRTPLWNPALPGEAGLPFVPFAILGYLAVYLAVWLVYRWVGEDPVLLKRAWLTGMVATTVHFLFFWLLPVRMIGRPEVVPTGLWTELTAAYFAIDAPNNCFPSLHVAYPALATCLFWQLRGRRCHARRRIMLGLTTIVAVSVVLVKQHYIADVVAALVLSPLIWWGVGHWLKSKPDKSS